MSEAEQLAMSLANNDGPKYPDTEEPHIVINADRTITVPDELKHIAVQFDHNIETVTFDCPKYWDGIDMSKMNVYINYKTPDGRMGMATAGDVEVDNDDESMMHFTWTIDKYVTQSVGYISFLVCTKSRDTSDTAPHWNSELCENELYVSEGLESESHAIETYPEIINELLSKMAAVEALPPTVSATETSDGYSVTLKNFDKPSQTIQIKHGTDGTNGDDGTDGVTFTPSVSDEGVLSWTNNGGLTNPVPRNIKGPQGEKGETGDAGGMIDRNSGDVFTAFIGTSTEWDDWQNAGNSTENVLFLPVSNADDPTPDYVTTDVLDDYALKTDIPSLDDYVKTEDLNAYARTADLNSYVKTTTLSNYARTSDLASYATTSDIKPVAVAKDISVSYSNFIDVNLSATETLGSIYAIQIKIGSLRVGEGDDRIIDEDNQWWAFTHYYHPSFLQNYPQFFQVGFFGDTKSTVYVKVWRVAALTDTIRIQPFIINGSDETNVSMFGTYSVYRLGTITLS